MAGVGSTIGGRIGGPVGAHVAKSARGGKGPLLAIAANSGTWNTFGSATGLSQDASGLLFAAVANSAGWSFNIALDDNSTYEITVTVTGLTGGSLRLQAYSAGQKLGQSNAISANGTHTVQLTTANGGSLANRIRVLANGATGTNSYRISAISARKVT